MRNNAAYLPENPIVYIIFPESIHNRASFSIFAHIPTTNTMTDNNPDARKPLILIAEDVESNYKLLEIILKKEYDLLWAKNGREAVDFAMEHKPDAILMDIKMPVMDGIEALKEIRRHTAELPVIMQTAYAFDTDRRTAEEAGCNGFITKPVMPRELKMYLDKYLNK